MRMYVHITKLLDSDAQQRRAQREEVRELRRLQIALCLGHGCKRRRRGGHGRGRGRRGALMPAPPAPLLPLPSPLLLLLVTTTSPGGRRGEGRRRRRKYAPGPDGALREHTDAHDELLGERTGGDEPHEGSRGVRGEGERVARWGAPLAP
ncbi:hypothetical protein DFH09DRAFT_1149243 [Mycena vulgaris]|nr:hypothetical protein DFH09DRAFT_1149243 [Mycena vulgaris]